MNNDNIQEMLQEIKVVLDATHTVVEAMQPGDRKRIKELAQEVALMVSKNPSEVLGFVNHFAHNSNITYVARGKNGGLIRGTRPVKVVKPAKLTDTPNQ